jgi:HEAT repeat protein
VGRGRGHHQAALCGDAARSIRNYRLDAERAVAPVIDQTTAGILAGSLEATDPKAILYALSLFEAEHHAAAHPAVRGLLDHPSAEVRARALGILTDAGDKAVREKVEQCLTDTDLAVRTAALVYLTRTAHVDPLAKIEELGDFPDYSIRSAMVAFLAKPGRTQNRRPGAPRHDAARDGARRPPHTPRGRPPARPAPAGFR